MVTRSHLGLPLILGVGLALTSCMSTEPRDATVQDETTEDPGSTDPEVNRLPAVDVSADCAGESKGPVELWEWVEAADAIVIGVVAELQGVVDPAWVLEDGTPRLVPQEECRHVGGAFDVILEGVEVLAGDPLPDRLRIRFGFAVAYGDVWTSSPIVLQDGTVYWPDDADGTIVPGMLIGGAVFRLEDADFHTFMSNRSQPIFEVGADGRIQFQEVRRHCIEHIGPTNLTGVTPAELAASAQEAMREVPARSREDNRLRQALRLDEEPDRVRIMHYGKCLGPIEPHRELCSFDWECPQGQICGELLECVEP